MPPPLYGFLADTWWFALTARLPDEDFRRLTELRVSQGFTAAQLVVGIPPETTPENPNAASPYGAAWTRTGEFNKRYLVFARERIKYLNQTGLSLIVYGAWGNQITWLGVKRMTEWWKAVLEITADLDVIYCLTGESNLQVGLKDLDVLKRQTSVLQKIEEQSRRSRFTHRIVNRLLRTPAMTRNRRQDWSQVLEQIAPLTDKPILIHPNPQEAGFECVDNPYLLAANTAQTGHTYQARPRLHQLPLAHAATQDPAGRGFINLEPWYEGILDQFRGADQLYAYWVSMLAGTISYCYGAHGIWNVGDGNFLSHWGSQTFSQALALDTPRLLGLSHHLFRPCINRPANVQVIERENQLKSIQRKLEGAAITFIPELREVSEIPAGELWLPMEGRYTDHPPARGQVVVISHQ